MKRKPNKNTGGSNAAELKTTTQNPESQIDLGRNEARLTAEDFDDSELPVWVQLHPQPSVVHCADNGFFYETEEDRNCGNSFEFDSAPASQFTRVDYSFGPYGVLQRSLSTESPGVRCRVALVSPVLRKPKLLAFFSHGTNASSVVSRVI